MHEIEKNGGKMCDVYTATRNPLLNHMFIKGLHFTVLNIHSRKIVVYVCKTNKDTKKYCVKLS